MINETYYFQHFPDVPKRVPKQLRSHHMFKKIIISAHTILKNFGREALSSTSLEIYSGTKKSTIYNYFPSLDAIVMEALYLEMRKVQKERSLNEIGNVSA